MDFSTCCAFQKGHWHASKRKQDREDLGRSGKIREGEWVKQRNALHAEDIKCTMLATKHAPTQTVVVVVVAAAGVVVVVVVVGVVVVAGVVVVVAGVVVVVVVVVVVPEVL